MHPIQCTLTFPSRGHLSWYSNALGWKWLKVVRDKQFAKIVLIEYAFDFVFSSWNESKLHLPVKSHEKASGDGFSVKHVMTYTWELQTLLFCYLHERYKILAYIVDVQINDICHLLMNKCSFGPFYSFVPDKINWAKAVAHLVKTLNNKIFHPSRNLWEENGANKKRLKKEMSNKSCGSNVLEKEKRCQWSYKSLPMDIVLKKTRRQWFCKRKKKFHQINKGLPTSVPTTKRKRKKRTLKDKEKRCHRTHYRVANISADDNQNIVWKRNYQTKLIFNLESESERMLQ